MSEVLLTVFYILTAGFFSVTKNVTVIKQAEYYIDQEDENCGFFGTCTKRVSVCCRDKEEVEV